jgi:hypothetical protein
LSFSSSPALSASGQASDNLHIVYRPQDWQGNAFSCSVDEHSTFSPYSSSSSSPTSPISDNAKKIQELLSQFIPAAGASSASPSSDREAGHFNTLNPIKYVELLIVNDKKRFVQKGQATGSCFVWLLFLSFPNLFPFHLPSKTTETNANELVNLANQYYTSAPFNPSIRLVLVYQITWVTNDPFSPAFVGGNADPNYSCADCTPTEVSVQQLLPKWHQWRTVSILFSFFLFLFSPFLLVL